MADYDSNRKSMIRQSDNTNTDSRRIPSLFQIVTVDFVDELIEEIATGVNLSLTLPWTMRAPSAGSSSDLLFAPVTVSPSQANKPATIDLVIEEQTGSPLDEGVIGVSTQRLVAVGKHIGHRAGVWLMRPGATDDNYYIDDITVPQSSNTHDQHIGLATCAVPSASEQNPKTGSYSYTGEEQVLGFKVEPTGVSLSGSDLILDFGGGGTAKFLDNGAGNNLDHSGRTVLVYKKQLPSAATGTAIQRVTVTSHASAQRATITGGLGDGTGASTTPSDYVVVVLGPIITDYDISGREGIAYVGVFNYDATAATAYLKTGTASYDDQVTHAAPTFRSLLSPSGSAGGGGFIHSRIVKYTGGSTGAGANVAYGFKMKAHPDDAANENIFELTDSSGANALRYKADGSMTCDADIELGSGSTFTSNGTVNFTNSSDFDATGSVTLGRILGPDVEVRAHLDMDDRSIKFDPTTGLLNIEGLQKVETPGGIEFGGPPSAGPTTYDFTYDIAAATLGTSEVRAGTLVAKRGTNYSASASGGAKVIVEGSDGSFDYEVSGTPAVPLAHRYLPFSTEAMLNLTCHTHARARWSGTGAPTSPANAYANSYHPATIAEPATLSVTPNSGGDSWTFEFEVRFPGGCEVQAALVTWARRYVDNSSAHTGGTDGSCTFEMFKWNRNGTTATSGTRVLGATSATTNSGVLTEETIAATTPITIADGTAQNETFRVTFRLIDSSTRGQTSRVHWLKFKLGLKQVSQVTY